MTLIEDREFLRELEAVPREFWPTATDIAARRGQALLDQADAARRETSVATRELRGHLGLTHAEQTIPSYLARLRLMGGVLRCMKYHACEHAISEEFARAPRPLVAMLAARVISCKKGECLLSFWEELGAADERNRSGEDMVCDLCLDEFQHFTKVAVPFGGIQVLGDVCDDCLAELRGGEKAAA